MRFVILLGALALMALTVTAENQDKAIDQPREDILIRDAREAGKKKRAKKGKKRTSRKKNAARRNKYKKGDRKRNKKKVKNGKKGNRRTRNRTGGKSFLNKEN